MMNSQEIETAVRLKLDLVVIILRDDAYGMIKWKQANMQFDEFSKGGKEGQREEGMGRRKAVYHRNARQTVAQ